MAFASFGTVGAGLGLTLGLVACGGVARDAPGPARAGAGGGAGGVLSSQSGASGGVAHDAPSTDTGGVIVSGGEPAAGGDSAHKGPDTGEDGGAAGVPGLELAGAGGSEGVPAPCTYGLQVLRRIDRADVVVAWPEQQRVAVRTYAGTIEIDDVGAVLQGGDPQSVGELSLQTLGLTNDWTINGPVVYGEDLLVTANHAEQTKLFAWHAGTNVAEVPVSLPPRLDSMIADPKGGIAFVAAGVLYRAIEHSGTWVIGPQIGASGQRRIPLAFDADDLLVGLDAPAPPLDNQADAGSGGEAAGSWTAKVERWNSANELVTSYSALGSPRAVTPAKGGWLIVETDELSSSQQMLALQWLPSGANELKTLYSERSFGFPLSGIDATVAIAGDRVFVTIGDRLRSGVWQSDSVNLTTSLGRWGNIEPPPYAVYAIGELLVLNRAGVSLDRFCGE